MTLDVQQLAVSLPADAKLLVVADVLLQHAVAKSLHVATLAADVLLRLVAAKSLAILAVATQDVTADADVDELHSREFVDSSADSVHVVVTLLHPVDVMLLQLAVAMQLQAADVTLLLLATMDVAVVAFLAVADCSIEFVPDVPARLAAIHLVLLLVVAVMQLQHAVATVVSRFQLTLLQQLELQTPNLSKVPSLLKKELLVATVLTLTQWLTQVLSSFAEARLPDATSHSTTLRCNQMERPKSETIWAVFYLKTFEGEPNGI